MKSFFNGLGSLITFVISVVLYVLIVVFTLTLCVRNIFSNGTVTTIVNMIDIKDAIVALDEKALDSLYKDAENVGINSTSVDILLASDELKGLLKDYVWGVVSYTTTGSEKDLLTVDKYNDFIDKNFDNLVKKANIKIEGVDNTTLKGNFKIKKSDKDVIAESVKEAVNENFKKQEIESFRVLFGEEVITGFIILMAGAILLMFLFRWSLYKWMMWAGVTSILAGIVPLLFNILRVVDFTFSTDTPAYLITLFKMVLPTILNSFLLIGSITVAIGIILIIIHNNVKRLKKETEVIPEIVNAM